MKEMKKNSENALLIIAIILLASSLVPLLYIGKYNVLSADDYSMCKGMHKIFEDGAGIKQLLSYAWQYAVNLYQGWRGYYIANYIEVFNPGAFNEHWIWITPLLMITTIVSSLYVFARCVLSTFFGKEYSREVLFIWALFTFMNIQTMPSPAEGFYWFAGAISYTCLHYISIMFIGLMIWGKNIENMKQKIIYTFFVSILAFIAGGSQYTTELFCVVLFCFLVVIVNRKVGWHRLIPGGILCIGFCISLLAPGNMARRGTTNGMSAFSAIMHSFTDALRFGKTAISPLFIVVLLTLLPCIWKLVVENQKKLTFRHPLIFIFFSYCVFAATFTPSLYGVGNIDAGRIKNQINIVFYLIFYVDVFYGLGWFAQKILQEKRESYQDIKDILSILGKYRKNIQVLGMLLIVLVFIGTSDKNTFSSVSALRSLVKGEAQTYYMEAEKRLKDYNDVTKMIVEVEPFSVKPHVLYFTDVVEKDDANYWINENVAEFYGKEEIILKNNGSGE